jgi:RNA polymerase II-associated protein 1
MSQSSNTSLVGSIFERKASSSLPPTARTLGKTGFPIAQHRSKSAFARARDEQRKVESSSRAGRPPAIVRLAETSPAGAADAVESGEDESKKAQVIAKASEDWRQQMEEENQRRVENMSPEELEAARKEILDQFGPDIAEILKQSRAMREAGAENPARGSARVGHTRTESKVLKSASR